jgi:hypothetical protein
MREVCSPQAAAIGEFHSLLLPATLQNALRTAFYRDLWASTEIGEVSVDTLDRLPVVDKDMVRLAGTRVQVRDALVCDEIFTSGTTGVPLVTVRGNREQRFIKEFFMRMLSSNLDRPLLRGLQINNPYHGYEVGVPSRIHFHRISVYDNGSFAHGLRVLTSSHQDSGVEERCTVLVGLERCLRAFSRYQRSAAPEGLSTSLTSVISYSQYLTRYWREEFEKVWGGRVVDRYSITEVFGGATECVQCGWWHFDPFVIPEVVGWSNRRMVREGVGILLLTALYPFQEAQPMVRYSSGDLVCVTHTESCSPGVLSMRPLGRARYGVPRPGSDSWLLTPASVLEAVDVHPEVARIPRFLDAAQVEDPYVIGHPKYRLGHRVVGGSVEITLELELKPLGHTARVANVERQVQQSLESSNPLLAAGLTGGDVDLRVKFVKSLEPDLISHAE